MLREDRSDQLVDWRIGRLPGGSAVELEQPAVSPADECAVPSAVVGDWRNDVINDTGTPSPGCVSNPVKNPASSKPDADGRLPLERPEWIAPRREAGESGDERYSS